MADQQGGFRGLTGVRGLRADMAGAGRCLAAIIEHRATAELIGVPGSSSGVKVGSGEHCWVAGGEWVRWQLFIIPAHP